MSDTQPMLLLIEPDPDLRELETLILTDAGYEVDAPADDTSPTARAATRQPDVIVMHVSPRLAQPLAVIDQLNADRSTQSIPVVVIAYGEAAAARALAGANVDSAIVAPYDVTALEDAVARALGNPPPAALLPDRRPATSKGIATAAKALADQTRIIVTRTLDQLRQVEPYKSRFDELTRGLVDALGTILGAIATGVQRGLTPEEVLANPAIAQCVREHVSLRRRQGLGLASTIAELHALARQADTLLRSLASPDSFDEADADAVSDRLRTYVDAVVREAVATFHPGSPSTNGRSDGCANATGGSDPA